MMKRKSMLFLTVMSIAVLFSGCGKVPQGEVDAAHAAIDSAKVAGADIYLIEDYAALQDSMKSIDGNIAEQNSKLFKNFNAVKEQLAYLTTVATEVKSKTEIRKAEVKQQVLNVQTEVNSILAQNNELLTKAPKGKEGTAALGAIKSDLGLIESSNGEVSSMVSDGQFLPALDKANAAKEKALAINSELNEVILKYNKNKRR